jgi:MFS family permease
VTTTADLSRAAPEPFVADSPAAWRRLVLALGIGAVGSVGMWSVVVALPVVQGSFGATRAEVSTAFTFAMLGFGFGGVLIGRITDRLGIVPAIALGNLALLVGYVTAGLSGSLWQFIIAHAAIGLGSSATFAPLMAEVSHWFERPRGIAVTVAASGNYVGGAIWPPLVEHSLVSYGWQATHVGIGIVAAALMSLLLVVLRSRMRGTARHSHAVAAAPSVNLNISANALTGILSIASVACCVAMAMPQVHIVAYCGDLGYGVARGAQMLSVMLAFGIVSRIGSGLIADRFGGLATLAIGSVAQCVALTLYLFFDGLSSLYVISALFGLFQGGLVPSYALIVRETMPAREAATRVGIVIMASVVGMSFGGWVSGAIFDATGSYRAAFLNGVAWNLVNMAVALTLLLRARGRVRPLVMA